MRLRSRASAGLAVASQGVALGRLNGESSTAMIQQQGQVLRRPSRSVVRLSNRSGAPAAGRAGQWRPGRAAAASSRARRRQRCQSSSSIEWPRAIASCIRVAIGQRDAQREGVSRCQARPAAPPQHGDQFTPPARSGSRSSRSRRGQHVAATAASLDLVSHARVSSSSLPSSIRSSVSTRACTSRRSDRPVLSGAARGRSGRRRGRGCRRPAERRASPAHALRGSMDALVHGLAGSPGGVGLLQFAQA